MYKPNSIRHLINCQERVCVVAAAVWVTSDFICEQIQPDLALGARTVR